MEFYGISRVEDDNVDPEILGHTFGIWLSLIRKAVDCAVTGLQNSMGPPYHARARRSAGFWNKD